MSEAAGAREVEVLVIGAGVSGLAAARALARRGLSVRLLEAATRPGGCLATTEQNGYLAELGASTVQESPELRELAADAGCEGDLLPAAPAARRRYVVHRGRLVPLPGAPPGLLTTPLLSWAAKARLATEPWRRRGTGPGESVASFFRRRLGAETLPLADAMGLGVYAGDPEELAIGYAFRRAYAFEHEHGSLISGLRRSPRAGARGPRGLVGFRGGWSAFALRLAGGLSADYGWRAIRVERLPPEGSATGFRVVARASAAQVAAGAIPPQAAAAAETRQQAAATAAIPPQVAAGAPTRQQGAGGRGPGEIEVVARRLIIALPAAATASLLAPLGHPLHTTPLAEVPHAPVAVVALGFARDRIAHPLDGFGFLAPHGQGRRVLGCLFSSTLFPDRAPTGHALLTAMIGGRRRPALVDLGDDELIEIARADLADLLGIRGEPEISFIRRWQPGIPQPTARWPEARDAAAALAQANPGLTILGSWLHGVGVPDCARAGWSLAQG